METAPTSTEGRLRAHNTDVERDQAHNDERPCAEPDCPNLAKLGGGDRCATHYKRRRRNIPASRPVVPRGDRLETLHRAIQNYADVRAKLEQAFEAYTNASSEDDNEERRAWHRFRMAMKRYFEAEKGPGSRYKAAR